jgi:IclR family transcriptional regulator, KDG regulon repressor
MSQLIENASETEEISPSDSNESAISSIDRAASILVCLSHGISTITELAKATNLNKSTVHRLLNTLSKPRFVSYNPANHRYYLGPLVTRLSSNQQVTHQYLVMCAMNEMKHLSVVTEETISLTLLVGTDLIVLYNIPSKFGIRLLDNIDQNEETSILPFGSSARVLFSQLNEKNLALTLKAIMVYHPRFYELVDMQAFTLQLKQIQQDGFAVSHNERILGVLSVSAPVTNYICPISLNVMGPETRMLPKVPGIIEELKASAGRLSAEISRNIQ